jgi:hypothetical protein
VKCSCLPHILSLASAGIMVLASARESRAQAPSAAELPKISDFRSIYVDCTAYSLRPGAGLGTYQKRGSGGTGPRGSWGTTIQQSDGKSYSLTVTVRQHEKEFLADFSVKDVTRGQPEKDLPNLSQSLNLTDMQPHMIEIAKDPDGHVYRLNLIPRLVEPILPKKFSTSDFGLDGWTFNQSAVILNDQEYVGSIGMSTEEGYVCSLGIAGLADVEFSLTEMTDSKPEGTLQHGTISIMHESTVLQIRGVLNGKPPQMLSGPYLVFVRWKQPEYSLDEARTMMKEQLSILKGQIEKGDTSIPKEVVNQIERKLTEWKGPFLMRSGARQLQKKEIVVPDP